MDLLIKFIKNSLDNLIFLNLFISVLSYWISIAFPSLKFGNRVGFINVLIYFALFHHILHIHINNTLFSIVMEFCNKGDLSNLIKRAKEKNVTCLREDVIWSISLQIILGLLFV